MAVMYNSVFITRCVIKKLHCMPLSFRLQFCHSLIDKFVVLCF